MNNLFRKFAVKASEYTGSVWAFTGAITIILLWICTGPIFHFSDTWQLIINTGTTIITFLMVFLIQNSQNRDMKAVQLKLDELIRGVEGARTGLVNLEDMPDEDIEKLLGEFKRMREQRTPQPQDGSTSAQNSPVAQAHQTIEAGRVFTRRQ